MVVASIQDNFCKTHLRGSTHTSRVQFTAPGIQFIPHASLARVQFTKTPDLSAILFQKITFTVLDQS